MKKMHQGHCAGNSADNSVKRRCRGCIPKLVSAAANCLVVVWRMFDFFWEISTKKLLKKGRNGGASPKKIFF